MPFIRPFWTTGLLQLPSSHNSCLSDCLLPRSLSLSTVTFTGQGPDCLLPRSLSLSILPHLLASVLTVSSPSPCSCTYCHISGPVP
eukprot:Em0054g7a